VAVVPIGKTLNSYSAEISALDYFKLFTQLDTKSNTRRWLCTELFTWSHLV